MYMQIMEIAGLLRGHFFVSLVLCNITSKVHSRILHIICRVQIRDELIQHSKPD